MPLVWDPAKRLSNLTKHSVDFASVEFFDFDTALVRVSLRGSDPRLEAYGLIGDRVHVLVYGIEARAIRVISLKEGEQEGDRGMAERSVSIPTDEEDAAINRGIVADPDTVVWTDAQFADAVRGAVAGPAMVPDRLLRRRGPQRTPTKELISLRLDQDVLKRWRATGPGWQGRINETLRRAVE